MDLDPGFVRSLADTIGLPIPDAELQPIAIRLGELMEAMQEIERDLGAEMDAVDPIPPVFPRRDW